MVGTRLAVYTISEPVFITAIGYGRLILYDTCTPKSYFAYVNKWYIGGEGHDSDRYILRRYVLGMH